MSDTKINPLTSNKFKETEVNSIQRLPDITGLTISEFHIDSRLDIVSGEADIYLCSGTSDHSGKKFILKYYHRKDALKQDVLEKLKTVTSPFVAPVEGYGECRGHQYVVRPYYEKSALSELLANGTRFSDEVLKTLIIPSIIEGLKAVHDVGILHKDLKPANLIPDDSGERIVLIDFGISSDAGKNTFVVTQTGMTPFYAAPEAMQGIFHMETDYYALGITVFELFSGFTPFQNPGLSPEDAARLASISKIEFPNNFPAELKKLILGLTYKDISHRNENGNPNRRWGYDEVRRWLNGEDVPIPGESVSQKQKFLPYRFDGAVYSTEEELIIAMLKNPEAGIRELGRGIISHHYYLFDEGKGKLCSKYEERIGSDVAGNIREFAGFIFETTGGLRTIFHDYQDYIAMLFDYVIAASKSIDSYRASSGKADFLAVNRSLLESCCLEKYADDTLKNTQVKALFSRARTLAGNVSYGYSDIKLALLLMYSLSASRRLVVHGKVYESPKHLLNEITRLSKEGRGEDIRLVSEAKSDLEFLEDIIPDEGSRQFLSKVLDVCRKAVFGDNEYTFSNAKEFSAYVKKCVREGKLYEIRSLLDRYHTSLKQLSEKNWGCDVFGELKNTVASFISIGEYLFAGELDFTVFINSVIERGRKDPRYIDGFMSAHRETLEQEVARHPRLKPVIEELYRVYNSTAVLGEYTFTGVSDFKDFVNRILKRGKTDPAYLKSFVTEHGRSLACLAKKEEFAGIVNSLTAAGSRVIELDEYVFHDVSGFLGFVKELKAENCEKLLRWGDFAREHKTGLEVLKNSDALAQVVRELQTAENGVEKGETIMVNGIRYVPVTIKKGDFIKFGSYPQKNGRAKEPIEWLVLEVNGNEAFIVSRYGLDCKQYHHKNISMTWKNCDLREWLNHDFLNEAFSKEEQQRIRLSVIVNDDNLEHGTSGGSITKDRVFCLSLAEAKGYFNNDGERRCQPTTLAQTHGARFCDDGYCWWWLRSPGLNQGLASYVYPSGVFELRGCIVNIDCYAVRPALRIIRIQ